jgi:hypothetical protein
MGLESHELVLKETAMNSQDPTVTDPDFYKVIFENERVRVLEYRDEPGDHTHVHRHPDSVMVTLSAFRRRVASGARNADVELKAGEARWVAAQEHTGENVGDTASHSIFIELKESAPATASTADGPLGPGAP